MTLLPPQPNTDELYDSYDKNLYLLPNGPGEDSVAQMMQSDPGANNSTNVQVSASDFGSGVDTSTTVQTTGSFQAGKKTYDNTVSGFILGVDPSVGIAKFYIGNTSSYINWDGATLTVVGGVNISSLNIPDTTTASSFHVDTSGNTWWGSNVATGISGATASITAAGVAVFKNISVGGSTNQFQINNNGIYSFGDGSDGAGVADGSTALAGAGLVGSTYTLTRDVYYTDLTISTGVTVNPGGYRIFGTGTLTINGTGKIARNGVNGGNGGNGSGGLGTGVGGAAGTGTALADGYLKGGLGRGGGGGGSNGSNGSSANGSNTSNSLGSNGANGGTGGAGPATATGGTATASNVRFIANWHLATLLDISSTGATVKFDNSAGAAGGAGGNGPSVAGGGGGAAGGTGGIIAVYFRNIVIGASAAITANGGNGGNGGNGVDTGGGDRGGGGGAGGNGGIIIIVYNSLSNSGSLTATAGTGGTGGSGAGSSTSGSNGTGGTIFQFQISL